MLLDMDMKEADNILVYFNDKQVLYYISANDEEGWIEVVDIKKMSPIAEKTPEQWQSEGVNMQDDLEGWEAIPTVKKYGKVEFKKIG